MTTLARFALVVLAVITVVVGWVFFIANSADYPVFVIVSLAIGTFASAWAIRCGREHRDIQLVTATVLTAITVPTFFAYLPNAVLLIGAAVFGGALVARRRAAS